MPTKEGKSVPEKTRIEGWWVVEELVEEQLQWRAEEQLEAMKEKERDLGEPENGEKVKGKVYKEEGLRSGEGPK